MRYDLVELISNWTVTDDDIEDMFEILYHCSVSYIKRGPLDHMLIIQIIKDLRENLDVVTNTNYMYFTDIICDAILLNHMCTTVDTIPELYDTIQVCKTTAYRTHV